MVNVARRQWILQNGPCKVCGSTERLEIDHIDPSTKLYEVGLLWSNKDQTHLIVELAKCQVLCHDCHMKKHGKYRERPTPNKQTTPHGTRRRYLVYGCRCDECREATVKENRERRHRKQQQIKEALEEDKKLKKWLYSKQD